MFFFLNKVLHKFLLTESKLKGMRGFGCNRVKGRLSDVALEVKSKERQFY